MIKFEQFTGGIFDTNCFLLHGPDGNVLIDAPQGADRHFAEERIDALLLTHGHFDHVADAAAILRRHGCSLHHHADTTPMITDPDFFRNWSFSLEVEPAPGGHLLAETPAFEVCGLRCAVLEVPGHCPGSLCFYFAEDGALFGGDVLFRGGVGRCDLPGGDWDLLLSGIRKKILPLSDATIVHPGHGPSTTVAIERATNPWLQG
jgi:glyoxylase-like metal-dependent hydrolase (beta-lactamase superfamily II)